MPRVARNRVFDPKTSGVLHCTQRCVRRALLCGRDPYTGRNFEHRRKWIHDRLQELASIFAFDVLNYSVLSNHLHLLTRNRPRVARSASWDGCFFSERVGVGTQQGPSFTRQVH